MIHPPMRSTTAATPPRIRKRVMLDVVSFTVTEVEESDGGVCSKSSLGAVFVVDSVSVELDSESSDP